MDNCFYEKTQIWDYDCLGKSIVFIKMILLVG